jgi:endonuclease/exonuclease/phosphatase family metal-dependent hydrolase
MSTNFKAISWNIDGNPFFRNDRIIQVIDIIKDKDPDFIALQEVTEDIYRKLVDALTDSYLHSEFIPGFTSFQTIVFVRKTLSPTFSILKLTSKMNKTAVHVTLQQYPDFIFTSCHLEAFGFYKDRRSLQIDEICENVKDYEKVVVCGDLNFIFPDEHFHDFIDAGPKAYTYDSLYNSNINDTYRTRLDRIYTKNVSVVGSHLLGTSPVDKVFPSDHFGMYFDFYITSNC